MRSAVCRFGRDREGRARSLCFVWRIGDLLTPVVEITSPAVDEDQCIFAFAVALVMDFCPVELSELRFTVRGERGGGCEQESD